MLFINFYLQHARKWWTAHILKSQAKDLRLKGKFWVEKCANQEGHLGPLRRKVYTRKGFLSVFAKNDCKIWYDMIKYDMIFRFKKTNHQGGKAPLSEANNLDVLAMAVLYVIYYIGELVLVTGQTVIIMYLRRSRLILGLPNLKFWIFGLMYYNCSGSCSLDTLF